MSHATIAIYRLPTPRAAPIGNVRVVLDRNNRIYVAGSRVASATQSGDFLILTLDNQQVYYVKAKDYQRIETMQRPNAAATRRRRSKE
jgi:hypothetical protein